jgi:hypothetical protein
VASRRWTALFGAAAALLWTLPAGLAGQGPGRLDVDVSPSRVAFPTPGVDDFERGGVRVEGVTVDVQTRGFAFWILTIRSEDPDLGGYGKPISDLQWRQPGDAWQPMATSEDVVAFGFTSRQVDLDFRTLLAWEEDSPESYGAGITLQVSSLFGAVEGARVEPAGAGPVPESPESACARIAVETRGRREAAGGSATGSAAEVERRCLDRLRDRLDAVGAAPGNGRGELDRARRPGAVGERGDRRPGAGR